MPTSDVSRPNAGHPTAVPGVGVRVAALQILEAVMRYGEAIETAFPMATQELRLPADRALAHAIAAEVLRRTHDLDTLIDSATQRPLPGDARARMVLRMALAQILVLGTPAHAAVSTALQLVEDGPRRLVHGVLGTLTRQGVKLPQTITPPLAVVTRWSKQWGPGIVDATGRAMALRPSLDIGLRDPGETAHWAETLGGRSFVPGHVRLSSDVDVPRLPGFAEGDWWVQDLVASIPARLLGAGEGKHVLDVCAAPGSKTMQLAAAGWRVTALDRSAQRLERMAQSLARTGLSAEMITADAAEWAPDQPADAVLLDAPCTATGIFRRHPDVLHRIGARQIAEMAALQASLLARAADWVRPGGRIAYAVCSLERAEGEKQIEGFLETRRDFRLVAPTGLPEGIEAAAEGWVRTGPWTLTDAGGTDGFFIAMLERG